MKMKKQIVLLLILIGGFTLSWASDGVCQHLSPDEFRTRQKAFITEAAQLTDSEAAKFFPIYFELQDKKKALSDKAWKQLRRGKAEKLSDAQYEEIMLQVYDSRIESEKLEKSYYEKYKKVISPQKIYLVQRAETKFHREILRGVRRGGENGQQGKRK